MNLLLSRRHILKCVGYLFVLVTATSFPSLALDKFSHKLVCQLAFQNLTVNKQKAVLNLLQVMPKQHQKLINQYNYQGEKNAINFAKACTWPDAIKKWKKYNQFKPWHYVNVARHTEKITQQNYQKNCANGCITKAIELHFLELTSAQSNRRKLEALMFLGHWLADIHQPLHVSFKSDRGGNNTKIISDSKCKNLHWYWDECLLTKRKSYTSYQTLINELQQQWRDLPVNNKPIDLPLMISEWANQSFQITIDNKLQYCVQSNNGNCEQLSGKVVITDSYQKHFQAILKQQILHAAKRLHLLIMQSNI